jgi:hypothetical protein
MNNPVFPKPICIYCGRPIDGEAQGAGTVGGPSGGRMEWWHPNASCNRPALATDTADEERVHENAMSLIEKQAREIERLSASMAEGNAKLKEAEEYGERQRTFKLEWHDKWNTEAKQHDETRSALARLEPYAVALKDAAQGVADLCGPPLDKDEREFVMHLDRLHSLLKVDCGHEIDSHASTEGKTS